MCVIYCVMHKLSPDFECVLVLQNCMAHSSTEKRLMLGDDGDQVVGVQIEGVTVIREEENPDSVKVEEVSFIKEEEEPEPIKFDEITVIKEEGDQLETTSTELDNECSVSCMSACLQCCAQHVDTQSCPSLLMSNI